MAEGGYLAREELRGEHDGVSPHSYSSFRRELHLKRQKAARVGGGKATSQRHQVHQQRPFWGANGARSGPGSVASALLVPNADHRPPSTTAYINYFVPTHGSKCAPEPRRLSHSSIPARLGSIITAHRELTDAEERVCVSPRKLSAADVQHDPLAGRHIGGPDGGVAWTLQQQEEVLLAQGRPALRIASAPLTDLNMGWHYYTRPQYNFGVAGARAMSDAELMQTRFEIGAGGWGVQENASTGQLMVFAAPPTTVPRARSALPRSRALVIEHVPKPRAPASRTASPPKAAHPTGSTRASESVAAPPHLVQRPHSAPPGRAAAAAQPRPRTAKR